MFPVTCRNCGELNLFTSPPPERVKCQSCGNYFRTDRRPETPTTGASQGRTHEPELDDVDDDDWDDEEDTDWDDEGEDSPVPLKAFAADWRAEAKKAIGDDVLAQTEWMRSPDGIASHEKLKRELSGGNRCFIATAACGTVQAIDVIRLREFRDSVLRMTRFGRAFISRS